MTGRISTKTTNRRRAGRALATLALGLSAVAISAAPAPAAAGGESTVLACTPWNKTRGEGGGSGEICDGARATGTIFDARADGRCPFIKFYYAGGGHKSSPHVGPAGVSKWIEVWADQGRYFNGTASAEWRSC
ncbi:hypothetical protein OG592_40705 [Streptomyces avidinii]|uniref:hypothetical protein n=1 Tax=Streptomyces avidinii TaxID=1895 RepID=UPI00386F7A77|nr:hypothetical protein OG592_00100 [Streptomyces avidinii]WST50047.1 hypothetical protein OG592_40705 [Streptomyces avidinii]